MEHPRFKHPRLIIAAIVMAFLTIIWTWYIIFDSIHNLNMSYGVSFDQDYAQYLKLDPKVVYNTLIDDWGFRQVRLSAHWDKLEPMPGKFDFSDLQYYLDESAKKNVKVILAIGNKTPRWPECHPPGWVKEFSREGYMKAVRSYMQAVVEKFKDHPAIEMWQVENEPFLPFGNCQLLTKQELKDEIALVKGIDKNHPVLVADSGELSTWYYTSKSADYFGTTLYRVVWNRFIGYWNYDWVPAVVYRWKMNWVGRPLDKAFVVELQAEPWSPSMNLIDLPIKEQEKSMSLLRLKKNIDFAQRVGVARTYLWGGEWWVWLRQNGYNEIPDFISNLNH
jgi:hypothetical protein